MRRAWSPAAEAKLRELYATTTLARLAFLLKRTPTAIKSRATALGLRRTSRRPWTAAEDRQIKRRYPVEATKKIALDLGRTERAVFQRAEKFGLAKTEAYFQSDRSTRIKRGRTNPAMVATQFRKGQAAWNKGLRGVVGVQEACRKTQFKKGHLGGAAAEKMQPIGALRVADGQLQKKVNNDRPFMRRWVAVSRLVWEAANGPIPAGHLVVFKRGQQTTVESEITIDRLELLTRAENMRRNSYHNYPQPIPQLVQLRGALQRQINKRVKANEKQD